MAVPPSSSISDEHFVSTSKVLDDTTTAVAEDHTVSPSRSLHLKSTHQEAHGWLSRYFPQSYLDSVECNWNMGNYVIDRTTGEKHFEEMSFYVRLGMHLLYYGTAQEKTLHWKKTLALLEAQSVKMGKEYDAPESKAHIAPFIQTFALEDGLAELKKPNIEDYSCFNEFFGRELQDGARPIAEPENTLVTSSPADCRLTAYPTVDLATKYWIKGFGFTLEKLLGDAELAQKFDGGSIVIARLAPQDYHRWHAPVDGTVHSIKAIPGAYYTVNPQAIKEPGTLDVFCENKRSVMMLQRTETNAPIAVVAVGAMLVGSIKYNDGVGQPGAEIKRGQCLGAFYYGGSTVIVLYPPGEIVLDADLVKNSTELGCETQMKVGWRTGIGPMTKV
jgi:phosphatidylserine decarboxylase